jgi:hypothetical protein
MAVLTISNELTEIIRKSCSKSNGIGLKREMPKGRELFLLCTTQFTENEDYSLNFQELVPVYEKLGLPVDEKQIKEDFQIYIEQGKGNPDDLEMFEGFLRDIYKDEIANGPKDETEEKETEPVPQEMSKDIIEVDKRFYRLTSNDRKIMASYNIESDIQYIRTCLDKDDALTNDQVLEVQYKEAKQVESKPHKEIYKMKQDLAKAQQKLETKKYNYTHKVKSTYKLSNDDDQDLDKLVTEVMDQLTDILKSIGVSEEGMQSIFEIIKQEAEA